MAQKAITEIAKHLLFGLLYLYFLLFQCQECINNDLYLMEEHVDNGKLYH